MLARVGDIARVRQRQNTTRYLCGPLTTSDFLLDKLVYVLSFHPSNDNLPEEPVHRSNNLWLGSMRREAALSLSSASQFDAR